MVKILALALIIFPTVANAFTLTCNYVVANRFVEIEYKFDNFSIEADFKDGMEEPYKGAVLRDSKEEMIFIIMPEDKAWIHRSRYIKSNQTIYTNDRGLKAVGKCIETERKN